MTDSSFTANWSTVSSANGYRLDVATDQFFRNYVPGYRDLDVGNVTNRNVTGLHRNTPYYYRVRAYNASGTSSNSNTIRVTTFSDPVTFTVNTIADPGDGVCDATECTLREAITAANAHNGADTINFNIPGSGPHTIQLTGALPDLFLTVNIENTSGESITVRRNTGGDYGIFQIRSGQTANISGIIVTNGNGLFYGGIRNEGVLTLTNTTMSSNTSGFVGGIYNTGVLALTNTAVSDNTSTFVGGIRNDGTMTLTNSTVSGNNGSGITNFGTMTLTNSSVSGNTGGFHGGIDNGGTMLLSNSVVSGNIDGFTAGGISNSGELTLINATVSANSTSNFGGGIYNSGTLTMTNSTLSSNTGYSGGGIFISSDTGASATLTNSTVSGNTARQGGGIRSGGGTVLLRNSIVAGNGRGQPDDISGSVDSSSSFNLIGLGGSGGLVNGVNHNIVGVRNPGLGPLGNNGGPTQTHALLRGSPAIDQGSGFGSTTDQRGFPRPYDFPRIPNAGDGSDIGAFELQP